MKTRLDRLLENLEAILERNREQADKVINQFPLAPVRIDDWQNFEFFLAGCVSHLESVVLNVTQRQTDREIHLARGHNLLKKIYGDSPMQTAFEIVRTGNEGGVYGLIQRVTHAYSQEYTENMIGMTVECYWNHRTPSQLVKDAHEYADKFASMIPGELTEGSAGRIKAQYRKLLNQHPFLIQKMRRGIQKK
jgi:hypothetical protein